MVLIYLIMGIWGEPHVDPLSQVVERFANF
jgi:hypothetical protein